MAKPVSRFQALLAELKRRNVFKVASVYAVTAWAASMGAAELLPAFGAPDWSVRIFVLFALLGLPIAVVLAWAYEITPQGVVRDATPGADPDPSPHRGMREQTTVLFGSDGSVRVSWNDGTGRREKVFHRDFRIGRDESCELHLDDPMISRRHAEISHREGLWWIQDLGSRNGTTLDGKLVTRVPLPAFCEVKLYDAGPVLQLEVKAARNAQTITSSKLRVPTH
jgi:hypothetical protein